MPTLPLSYVDLETTLTSVPNLPDRKLFEDWQRCRKLLAERVIASSGLRLTDDAADAMAGELLQCRGRREFQRILRHWRGVAESRDPLMRLFRVHMCSDPKPLVATVRAMFGSA